jgi:signal transduction histidine kinase
MNITGIPAADNQSPYQTITMAQNGLWPEVLENLGSAVALLTTDRKIAYANSLFLDLIHEINQETILALRFGDTLDCIHLKDGQSCGETRDCGLCGANQAIRESAPHKPVTKECRVLKRTTNEALDLEVTASQVGIQNQIFILFTVVDISSKKRQRILERIFYHDILNGISSLQMASELLERDSDKVIYYVNEIKNTVRRLLSDINSQKLLSAAEGGDLKTNKENFSLQSLLEDLGSEFETLSSSRNCPVIINSTIEAELTTDYALLSRVLINAVKNAIEASAIGQTVNLTVAQSRENLLFSIQNANMIPEAYQNQIFKRSFSTKGMDRGLGTYSIKILTENYLMGKVHFTSTQESGTTFFILIPMVLP